MITTKIYSGRLERFVSFVQGGFVRKPLCPSWLNGIGCLLFCVLLTSCGKETLAPKEYVKWVEDESNGLRITKQLDNFTFRLQYKPAAYMAIKQTRNTAGKAELKKEIESFGEMQYYNLTIKAASGEELLSEGIGAEEEYYQRLQYYTSMVQDDITLIQGKDTLPCALAHFERNYGLSPENTLVLAFETPKQTNNTIADRTIVYNDQVLQTGPIQFLISGKDLADLPEPQLK